MVYYYFALSLLHKFCLFESTINFSLKEEQKCNFKIKKIKLVGV